MSRPASSLKAALLLALAALLWLGTLGVRPLYKPDEARYAEIPREMVASGDWVTPRLNGFKYFEKPPLQYWATAAAFEVFGVNSWSARLWTGLAALAGVVLVVVAGNRLFAPPAGILAGVVLASSPLYLLLGQVNTLDMGVTFFLSAAVLAFALAQRDAAAPAEQRRWMLAFWAACALAVLSKGLIGIVLPLGAVALYVIVRRDWALLRRLELARGGLVFSVIAVPWFVAVSAANDEFAYFFFVQEHLLRFSTKMHARAQPAWFFVAVLAAGLWPWLLATLAAWFAALRPSPGPSFSPKLFLALWAAVVFAFFSASGSKLAPYILPIVPALALLVGEYLAREPRRWLLMAQSLLVATVALAIGGVAWWLAGPGDARLYGLGARYAPWLAAAAAIAFAGAVAGVWLAARARSSAAIGSLSLGVLAALLVGCTGHRVLSPAYSAEPMIASLPQPLPREVPVFTVETYDHSIPWSLRRTVTMVVYKDELGQAIAWQPEAFIPDLAAFARAWGAEREAYAFFALRDFERLRAQLALPMEIVARSPRYVIVRKP